MQEDPSPMPPQFFTGREVDMYHVLNAVLAQKLVSVVGEKGVGRSSLVYGLCHYVNERKSTIILVQRIYFMKATQNRGSDRFVVMLRELLKKIMQDSRAPQQQDVNLDFESLIHSICKMLNNEKALLVIDCTEFLEGSVEAQDLVVFLSNLFREARTKHVRVLLIGRHPLGIPSIGGVVEQPYHLGPLSFCNTVRLFGNLCPHLHTPGERQRFYNRLVTDGGQSDLLPSNPAASERTKTLFAALGNGIPSLTEKAAYTISSEDLSRLEQI
jgi:NACHT domain